LVVSIQLPKFTRSSEEVEEELFREMQERNTTQVDSTKAVRILCKPDDLWKKARGSLSVSFEVLEAYEEAIWEGVLYSLGQYNISKSEKNYVFGTSESPE